MWHDPGKSIIIWQTFFYYNQKCDSFKNETILFKTEFDNTDIWQYQAKLLALGGHVENKKKEIRGSVRDLLKNMFDNDEFLSKIDNTIIFNVKNRSRIIYYRKLDKI